MPEGMYNALESTIARIMYCYQGALGDDPRCGEQALRSATAAGFIAALDHYRPQLEKLPELKKWYAKRRSGGDKGRAAASKRKQDMANRIRDKEAEMRAAGEKITADTIAAAMGVSRSTVMRAFKKK
jgi:AraC-like DNA-binding protein